MKLPLTCSIGIAAGCSQPNPPAPQPQRVEVAQKRELTQQERDECFKQNYTAGVEKALKGEYASALGDFEHALEMNPNSADAWLGVGACHESIGDPVMAINCYRKALKINPLDPDAYANLGTSYIKLYHRERNPTWQRMALDAWRQSLALNPDQPDLRTFVARESGPLVRK